MSDVDFRPVHEIGQSFSWIYFLHRLSDFYLFIRFGDKVCLKILVEYANFSISKRSSKLIQEILVVK